MLRLAASPPDEEHPYGFSKAEYLAAGIEGALIVLAAAGILLTAVPRLLNPEPLDAPLLGLSVSAAASVINLAVAIVLLRVGKKYRSIALEADGKHLMTDVWTSVGVILGVALVFATGWLRLDPLVALGVAAHIVWTGVGLVRRSASGLLDGAIPQADRDAIQKVLTEYSQYGVTFHALRTRRAAARRFVSFHLLVPDRWSVARAHRLSEEIEARIRTVLPHNVSVFTHIEPISDPASYEDQGLDR